MGSSWGVRRPKALPLTELPRPHGETVGPLSRERYESVTKEIRFRMYRLALDRELRAAPGQRTGVVVIGHHQDDVDENRLTELSKGNLVHVDGMHSRIEHFDVTVLRPLLQLRKVAMFALADHARLPYMASGRPCPWGGGAADTVWTGRFHSVLEPPGLDPLGPGSHCRRAPRATVGAAH